MNNNNNDTSRPAKNEEKKFTLQMLEHMDFNATMESIYLTTVDIGQMINNVFSSVFADYEGCIVLPATAGDPNQNMAISADGFAKPRAIFNYVNATLFFCDSSKPESDGMIKNLQPYGTESNIRNTTGAPIAYRDDRDRGLVDTIFKNNFKAKGRLHELTKKTKEALSEFISVNTDKNFWDNNVVELSDNTRYGNLNYTVHLSVPGLDVNRLLKFIYGNKLKDDQGNNHYIDYMINLIKPTSTPMPNQAYGAYGFPVQQNPVMATTYLCIVNRLDNKNLDDLCTKMGMCNYSSTINMVKA